MGEVRQLERSEAREMMRDPMVLQALQLADRLRDVKGSALDSDEYYAISAATGVSEEYIKFLEQEQSTISGRNFVDRLRTQYFSLDSDTRRYVSSGMLGTVFALLMSIGFKLDSITGFALQSHYSVFQTIAIVVSFGAIYNAIVAKSARSAAISGAIFGGVSFILGSLFFMVLLIRGLNFPPPLIFPIVAGCAAAGAVLNRAFSPNRKLSTTKTDRNSARQDLLKQLVDLQDQLREGQQAATFLSLDVVGSTKMKLEADPLAVEFTFTEYHKYVEQMAERYQGHIHSTAGDGITVAFEHPQNAFHAAKRIQTGLVEFNAFRNKIDQPLQLRAGIHTGQVLAPEAGNMASINFASVIDIAAHLQKECPVGGVAISDAASETIVGGPAGIGHERITVHGNGATIWQRKKSLDHFKLGEPITQGG